MRFSKWCAMSALLVIVSSGSSVMTAQAAPGNSWSTNARECQTLQAQICDLSEMLHAAQHQKPSRENKIKLKAMMAQMISLKQRLKDRSAELGGHHPDSGQDVINRSRVVML